MRKIILMFCLSCAAMFGTIALVTAEDTDLTGNAAELFDKIQLFSDSITLISAEYVQPVKVKDLVYGAIKGMMSTLDKYSKFLSPEDYNEITEETKGEFGGIGVEVGMRQEVLTVLKVMEASPAEKAGIKEKDRIVKIAGHSTEVLTLDESVDKMRGEAGTYLEMDIFREASQELLPLKIKRAVIKLKSIKDVRVIRGDIGYLRLEEFQERTAKDLKDAVKDLQKQGIKSLILDLRGNPGGLLDAAVEVADLFLPQGAMIVYTKGRDPGKKMEFLSRKEPVFTGLDIAVLVDHGSASAAEILAGALRDNKIALLVGTPTFGKGSVQTVIPLQDGSGLRLTTAAYYTPSGMNLMDKGIDPDVRIDRQRIIRKKKPEQDSVKDSVFEKARELGGEKTLAEESPKGAEGIPEEYDNQLNAAIDILKGARIFCEYKFGNTSVKTGEYSSSAADSAAE